MSEEKKVNMDRNADKREEKREEASLAAKDSLAKDKKDAVAVEPVSAVEDVPFGKESLLKKKGVPADLAADKAAGVKTKRSGQKNAPKRGMKEKDPESGNEGIERVVKINRVSKVVKGGKNFSFNALVVAGDGKGQAGIGFGKSNDVVGAITKGSQEAKKSFRRIQLKDDTIPHEVIGRFKASRIVLKPASPGTGVIAGGAVRALCDAVGIKNILTKSLGSRNSGNVVKATMDGFLRLRLKRRG